jgi:epoxyqueuosine reductase QueG
MPHPTTPVPFVSANFEKRTNPELTLRGVKSIVVIGVANSSLFSDDDYHIRVKNLLRELAHELNSAQDGAQGALPTSKDCLNGKHDVTKMNFPDELNSAQTAHPTSKSCLDGKHDVTKMNFPDEINSAQDTHPTSKSCLDGKHNITNTHPPTKFNYKILVDSAGLDERALAHRAGLGFYGRNGLIISKEFGSRFNIGCLLCDVQIPAFSNRHEDFPTACPPDCDLCIAACPTNALDNGKFNVSRCVSYLTQKDELSPEEEKLIALGGQIYGCEICQDACPFNAARTGALPTPTTFGGNIVTSLHDFPCKEKSLSKGINPLERLSMMSDEEIKNTYGHTAILWRGAEILRRNARILSL